MPVLALLYMEDPTSMLIWFSSRNLNRIARLALFPPKPLFSPAPIPPEIRKIPEHFLQKPVRVEVSRPASTVASTTQNLVKSGREPHEKRETLRRLIRSSGLKNAIVFCNRKRDVATLHRSLVRHGFSAVALHGDLDQQAR